MPEEFAHEPQPVLSDDGLGISLEEARNLLAMKHQSIVSLDDPLLMLVTLNNAFLSEQEKLFKRHSTALSGLMSAELEKFSTETESVMQEIRSVSSSAVVEQSREQLERLTRTRRDMFWMSGIMILTALLNILAIYFQGWLAG